MALRALSFSSIQSQINVASKLTLCGLTIKSYASARC